MTKRVHVDLPDSVEALPGCKEAVRRAMVEAQKERSRQPLGGKSRRRKILARPKGGMPAIT